MQLIDVPIEDFNQERRYFWNACWADNQHGHKDSFGVVVSCSDRAIRLGLCHTHLQEILGR